MFVVRLVSVGVVAFSAVYIQRARSNGKSKDIIIFFARACALLLLWFLSQSGVQVGGGSLSEFV